MALKFFPIGSVVKYENVQLIVVPQTRNLPSCSGCYFTETNYGKCHGGVISCHVHGLSCTKSMRKDKRHVIFKIKTQ